MKKGFTLLELIVVIIILGILATLGFSQYTKMVEKGRSAEAKIILGQIRSADIAYFQEHNPAFAGALADLAVSAPTNCTQTTHYFSYAAAAGVYTATRCTALTGKQPGAVAPAYTITLTTAGAWGGSAGYY